MTERKQIIIDDIDVAGCVRLQDNEISCDLGGECKGWENCYYKQLKRKEQELQQAIDNYVQLDLQRVKEYNELVDLYKAKEQEYEKLKQTLIEIKEIAKEDFNHTCWETYTRQLKQILQKISEVLDDRQKQQS